jgi:hypothetical protein
VFLFQSIKRIQPIREDSRQLEKSQSVAGRGSVNNYMGILATLNNFAQLKQRHHFVDARQCEAHEFVYFGPVEEGPALEDFGDGTAKFLLEFLECGSGIHFARIEAGLAVSRYQRGVRADCFAEAVGEGVSRICRDEVNSIIASSSVEQRDRGSAGGSGFSDSPFPGEKKDPLLK